MICLGIEGTAEKTGVGIVDSDGNILAMAGEQLFPEKGGIHPRIAAEHHGYWIPKLIPKAIDEAGISYDDLDLISFFTGSWSWACFKNCSYFCKNTGTIIK